MQGQNYPIWSLLKMGCPRKRMALRISGAAYRRAISKVLP
jgi:hypothetical protein